jgi:hypothetical protein
VFWSRRLALHLAAAAIGIAAVFGAAGALHRTSPSAPAEVSGAQHVPGDHELAVTTRVVHPKSVLDDRAERTHPVLLLWVAAFLALLLILRARPWRTATRPVVPPRASWAGRYDRGPPALLIAS